MNQCKDITRNMDKMDKYMDTTRCLGQMNQDAGAWQNTGQTCESGPEESYACSCILV